MRPLNKEEADSLTCRLLFIIIFDLYGITGIITKVKE